MTRDSGAPPTDPLANPNGDHTLTRLGWTPERDVAFEPYDRDGLVPGRVVSRGSIITAATEDGTTQVIVQRRFKRSVADRTQMPAIGDWLALAPEATTLRQAALRAVLPRGGTFIRQRLSDGQPQVLAANVDIAFIVAGLDHDLNLRRIERYLVLARDGGVSPVVVLNKADLADDLDGALAAVATVAEGTPVLVASAATSMGLEPIRDLIGPGMTACLLGSSGVGKSTITNALLGEPRQKVKALRDDDSRGRHTTSHRELFVLANGGLLIDTPGLRTVGVLGDAAAVQDSFGDVEALADFCRFSDCQHQGEPGCAVRASIEAGTLSAERLTSYQTLEAERRSIEIRLEVRARREAERSRSRSYRQAGRDATRLEGGE
ncbi:MAG: ribosome small subunit-dependent GTPase A [Chloroflexota bacterium]